MAASLEIMALTINSRHTLSTSLYSFFSDFPTNGIVLVVSVISSKPST